MYPQKARPWFLSEWIRGTGHHSWPSQEKSQDSKGENTAVWSFPLPATSQFNLSSIKGASYWACAKFKKKKKKFWHFLKTRKTLFRTTVIDVKTIATREKDGTQLGIPGLGSIVPTTWIFLVSLSHSLPIMHVTRASHFSSQLYSASTALQD